MFDTFTKKYTRDYTAAYTNDFFPIKFETCEFPSAMPLLAAFHLGVYCLPTSTFRGLQTTKS